MSRKVSLEKKKEYYKRYYEKHKEEIKAKQKAIQQQKKYWYKHNYGITLEEKDQLFASQDCSCAICRDTIGPFHVDHDHATNKVRGILCCHCNRGLGGFRDSAEFLNEAINYLKRNKK